MRVTDFARFVPTLIAYLAAQTSCFKSSRLAQFIPAWQQITSDTEILQMVLCQYILNSVPSLLRNILHQGNALVGKKKLLLPLKLPAYSRKHSWTWRIHFLWFCSTLKGWVSSNDFDDTIPIIISISKWIHCKVFWIWWDQTALWPLCTWSLNGTGGCINFPVFQMG